MPERRRHPRSGEGHGNVVIVGASVRSLAQSAARGGWQVHAADLFRDVDLTAAARVAVQVSAGGYPDNLGEAMQRFPPAPWCYTGAIENHPALIDRLAGKRTLAGNHGPAVGAVRDPLRLGEAVRTAGLAYPTTFLSAELAPTDGSHLVKPLRSAAGRGIARWHGVGRIRRDTDDEGGRVWQRFIPGEPWAAAYAIDGHGGRLVGASRQLLGQRWCGARPFRYCGSIDEPLCSLAPRLRLQFERLGGMLAREFGLVGLVGADMVVDGHGCVHVIEVNPRPTSSMELVERATGVSLATLHLAACGVAAAGCDPSAAPAAGGPVVWSKAILFARHDLRVDADHLMALAAAGERWAAADGGWPPLADLPAPDTRIAGGGPLLTVFARAATATGSRAKLRRRATAVRRLLSAGLTTQS